MANLRRAGAGTGTGTGLKTRPYTVLLPAALMLALVSTSLASAADPDKGKAVFEQCAACHSLDGTGDYDGPTLKGIIGRKAGSLEDYRYSAAMKRSDVTWDATTLDKYVADPQAFIPGNRMAFAGITDQAQRDDLIAYLTVASKTN